MDYKTWIDETYKNGIKYMYDLIDGFEYGAIRLIFILLHGTSIWFNVKFFNGIGTVWIRDQWVLGGFQILGSMTNLGLSLGFKNDKPYKQLFLFFQKSTFCIICVLVYFLVDYPF